MKKSVKKSLKKGVLIFPVPQQRHERMKASAAIARLQRVSDRHAGNIILMGVKVVDLDLVLQAARLGFERLDEPLEADECDDCGGKGWVLPRCNGCNVELTDQNRAWDEEESSLCRECEKEEREET